MVSILTACDVDFGIRFKPKIFDKGNEIIPIFFEEAFAGNGGKRRKEETIIELIEETPENEISEKSKLLEDCLAIEVSGNGLEVLTSTSTYANNKKVIGNKNNLIYIFVPDFSQLNAANDNIPRRDIYPKIELVPFIPYPRRYTIAFAPAYYFSEEYGTIKEIEEITHYSEIELVDYMMIPRLYAVRLFASRDEILSYTLPANDNNFDVSEFRIPEIKYVGVATFAQPSIASERYLVGIEPIPDSIREGLYKLRAEPISTPENSIETLVHPKIKIDYEPEVVTEDYVPVKTLLEDTVKDSYKHAKANTLNFPVENDLDNLIKFPANDNNHKRNQNQDISNIILQAFSKDKEKYSSNQELVYQEADQDPKTNIFPTEAANDNVNNTVQRNDEANYRNPRRNRNNFEWYYKNVKTKYKSIIRTLERKLREIGDRGKNYILNFVRKNIDEIANLRVDVEDNSLANEYEDETKVEVRTKESGKIYTSKTEVQTPISSNSVEPDINKSQYDAPNKAFTDEFYIVDKLTVNQKARDSVIHDQALDWLEGFKTLEKSSDCTVSFAYIDDTGAYVGYNDDVEIEPASMTKIAIMYAALYLSCKDKLDLNDKIKNTESKRRRVGTQRGMEKFDGEEYTILELINYMVEDSDNYPATLLLAYIGRRKINNTLQEMGYDKTMFKGFYRDGMRYEENRTTAREMAFMKHNIVNGKLLGDVHKQIALNAMSMNDKFSYIFDDNQPELLKIGNSRHSMGLTARFSGNRPFTAVLNINTANDIYDDNFQGIQNYTPLLITNFFSAINRVCN